MSLTPEQIAFETANLEAQYKAVQACDMEATMAFFKDATITDRIGVHTGAHAVQAYFEMMWGIIDSWTTTSVARTFDPAQSMIWESTEGTTVIKADPERKPIKIRGLTMIKKPLGIGEKKVDAVIRYSDDGGLKKRLQELGINIGA